LPRRARYRASRSEANGDSRKTCSTACFTAKAKNTRSASRPRIKETDPKECQYNSNAGCESVEQGSSSINKSQAWGYNPPLLQPAVVLRLDPAEVNLRSMASMAALHKPRALETSECVPRNARQNTRMIKAKRPKCRYLTWSGGRSTSHSPFETGV